MIRSLGCVLILASCGLCCVKLHLQMVDTYRDWCLFQGILLEIRRNNRQACVIMAQLLKEAARCMPAESEVTEATLQFVLHLSGQCGTMDQIWEEYVEAMQTRLRMPPALLIQTKRLGSVISHKDSETIERYLDEILGLLTEEIKMRSKTMKTRDMVRSSLCAMTGIMTILLLI